MAPSVYHKAAQQQFHQAQTRLPTRLEVVVEVYVSTAARIQGMKSWHISEPWKRNHTR